MPKVYVYTLITASDCSPGWVNYLGFCYSFQVHIHITWVEAEKACQSQGSHLASVMDIEEMTVLHYLLTTDWLTNNTRTYIGVV